QSTKMAAMGQLAGGIAHDFNNMLTAILNFAQFAADDLGPAHPVTPDIEEVLAAGRKTHMLTRQLLAFSRKTPVNPRVLDLNEVLVEIYALIRRMLGEHIEMLLEPLEGPCRVLMDRSQLEQIIVNLCLNARDAMPRGGHLKLSIERQTDVTWLPERSYVCIRVSDSGEGMTRETRERCFEPFFTTKPVGKGTGMGLAMAYGIVKQARGDVKVHTSMGAGTTFLIFLPEAEGVPELAEAPGQADAPGSRGERILLVEDQAEVRRAAVRILERAGYDVVEAEGAWEATSMDLRDVDLLLTDVVMPGISGPELARLLREAYPRMRVIFMSGYAAGATAHLMPDAGAPMLQKPFSHRQLMRHVREALDRALPRQPP
ncbi:MAG: CheY-like chemotaxis protein, partial [Myxococcota bacterium]